ncbi:sensor histidine kinase [Arthrobacter sp. NyZ413]|uniref:sensor histidine kinase n=1 Tax=Arthrobacter sp. NyZ413 TaxID=3144669 RepID=UPI003BF806BD
MRSPEMLTVLAWMVLWAVLIGALTLALLRLLRGASILVQICLVVVATVGVLVAGMVSAFNAMFISAGDLEVMWYILGAASVVALGIAAVLGAGVSRNAIRLVAAARRLGSGETLDGSASPLSPARRHGPAMNSELAQLANELEASGRKLEESRRREAAVEAARRELVSWISHDLRTPLASMRAMAEALEDGMASDVGAYYRKIIGQTEQMAAMVNDLLELSKIQAGTLRLSAEALDVYDLVSDAIADLAPLAAQRGIRLDGGGDRECMAVADGPSVGRAIRNVLLNAILYSRPGGAVRVGVGRDGDAAVVDVVDTCGGIDDDDLAHVFETGWQKDRSRGTHALLHGNGTRYSGSGVGLSMVAGIVKAHGGAVTVENTGEGCRFSLRLPSDARETPPSEASGAPAVPLATISTEQAGTT